jgi:hypothetical protein
MQSRAKRGQSDATRPLGSPSKERHNHTSVNGTIGGPDAISADLVPGLIRLVAPESIASCPPSSICPPAIESARVGDFGPIWTSGIGGGLGRRGELGDDNAAALAIDAIADPVDCGTRPGREELTFLVEGWLSYFNRKKVVPNDFVLPLAWDLCYVYQVDEYW